MDLQPWPGIGTFGAALLLAEIGDIRRFRTSHEPAAYAGLTPSTQSSGDKTTHGGVGRSGSSFVMLRRSSASQVVVIQNFPELVRRLGQTGARR